jgi:AmpE protein
MSAVLIAVILALVLGHAVPQLAQLRRYEWFASWLTWLGTRLGGQGIHASRYGILLSLGLPLLVVGLLQWWLHAVWYGLPAFVFALAVLFYCWGPRDLDLDVEAVVDAPDTNARRIAVQALFGPDREPRLDGPALVEGVFQGALERWFGVLLWFMLLGPFGALLYRLTQVGATRVALDRVPVEHGATFARLKLILDWPAAQLMTLGLALASNFDAVLEAWSRWHAETGRGWFTLDTGFLGAAARVSVDCELAEEQDEAYAVDAPPPPAPALPALKDAISLAWRILLLWLAVLALFVLAGYVN